MSASRPTWDEVWMHVAYAVAARSLCERDQVGAVVVSANNRIVDTGYNGPPRGMPRDESGCENWCPRAKIQTTFKREIQGVTHDILTGATLDPAYNDCHALHAEANALMFGDRTQREGGTIYISSGVCGGCAKLIANSGLARVVFTIHEQHSHRMTTEWLKFMQNCGIVCDEI